MAKKKTTAQKVKDASKKAGKKASNAFAKASKKAIDNPVDTAKIIGIIALIGVAYVVVRSLSKVTDQASSFLDGDQNIENNIPKIIETPGVVATINNQDAINFASQLLDAFNAKEPFWGTDEDVVESVFDKLKNAADFALVFNAFGLKDYNGYNSPPTGFFSNLDSYDPKPLDYWLREEIKPSDGVVYDKVKSRVESANLIF